LKQKIYAILFSIYTALLRTFHKPEPDSALVMPPYSPGSFGDEAVVTSVVVQLARQGVKKIGLVSYRDDDNWSYLSGITEVFCLQDYYEYESWGVRFRFCRMASRYERFFVLGTDVMDGYYGPRDSLQRIAVAKMASRAGVPTRIISFSFNNRPDPDCVQALKALPADVRLFGRDPLTLQRLIDNLQRPVELVADVAFMLEPSPETDKVQSVYRWVEAERQAGRAVIGVNANHILLEQVQDLTPERLVNAYAAALHEITQRYLTVSFLFVPHDIRGRVSDVMLAEAIYAAVPAEVRAHCMIIPTPCKPAEIKAMVAGLDFVLSGKMHLAIAALGQGVPVACIAYQDKFEGLFQHFELDGLTIQPEDVIMPGKLSAFFIEKYEQREALAEQVRRHLPAVRDLARVSLG
jgi:polysaccharide pyruvyl transferase WcaK-like protein